MSKRFKFNNCWPWKKKNKENEEEQEQGTRTKDKTSSNVLTWVAKAYSTRPLLILFLTLGFATITSKIGIREYGFPEFEDPYLGFETRFTPIANRLVTLENLRKEVSRLGLLENYPGERLSGREFRRRRRDTEEEEDYDIGLVQPSEEEENDNEDDFLSGSGIGGYCTKVPYDDYARLALEIDYPTNIFDHKVFMLICYFEKLVEALPEFTRVCEHDDSSGNCCPIWSLPNYVKEYANKTDCSNVKEDDIQLFKEGLIHCRNEYRDPLKMEACYMKQDTCPKQCWRDEFIHSTIFMSLDSSFIKEEHVRYTMLILPIPKTRGSRVRTALLETALMNIQLPEDRVRLGGYDFGDKDWIFKKLLISDLKYVMIGSIIVFLIVLSYTKSFSVTAISFLVLILSLGVSYFLYKAVFGIPYFPFMNMLVTIIVMGIGTDGTLILGSEWYRLKSKLKDPPNQKVWDSMMLSLLEETTAPLIVTTCTTAGAFFASLTSSITTIKCFSIFAGTSIIVGFILLYLCVPTTLVLSDVCVTYLTLLFSDSSSSSSPQNGNKISSKLIKFLSSFQSLCSLPLCSKKVQKSLRSQSRLLWTASFLCLLSVLVWSCLIVFHTPGYQVPDSEQFQLLSGNHPIEVFDREIEPRFNFNSNPQTEDDKLTLYFIWGLVPQDTGFGLDPNDNGNLTFDPTFSLRDPKSQKWMKKLCTKLKKEGFYDEISNTVIGAHYDSCFLETMTKWMKRECKDAFQRDYQPCCKGSKFPYSEQVFDKCVQIFSKDLYKTPTPYFKPDVAGPKFFVLKDNENETYLGSGGQLATFALRVRTNVSFSLNYEKMRSFYQELESFYEKEIKDKVPKELENGFFVSSLFDFFDLQNSLLNDTWTSLGISSVLCFLFLLAFSQSLLIAFGAVLCIISIVIVSSALLIVLFDWKLGVFESIAVTVAIGLSDFTAHHSLEYGKRKSVSKMMSPTFFSALTTVTIGLSILLFSNVLVYQQIGMFFTTLITISWIYSVFFLTPILNILDKGKHHYTNFRFPACQNRNRTRTRNTVSVSVSNDNVSAVIFTNPNASSRRNSQDELLEPSTSTMINVKGRRTNNCSINDTASPVIERVKLLKKIAVETSV